ncbi:MAG: LysR family transcriptional regulator [Eubacterium sp.]|nr:LysR family transcriptional regulator [Eubacterium sp.]MDE6155894.1 LysR family transcriptional regulator [Eubacterium sp.]
MYNPQLDTFICVADAGSFNKAAEELYITPTAVIKQINLLEKSIDIKLFERTHRGLVLTNAGRSFYNDAKYIIQYSGESIARAKNVMQDDATIRIGSSPMTPTQLLVNLWPKIHKIHPDIKFQLIPFENTPENAREILNNLGQNIDVVAGIFDESYFNIKHCKGLEICRTPICCALSLNHSLAGKEKLCIEDLHGENLMLIRRGWSSYVDRLRDEIWTNHPKINIVDFNFYNVDVFNRCQNSNDILMAINAWSGVHPLLKIIPVEWEYSVPYGLLHSDNPSDNVKKLLSALHTVIENKL